MSFPLIPFHSRKFSIVIPGYFLEMVHRESPLFTIWTFVPLAIADFVELIDDDDDVLEELEVTGFFA
jgi:hypothetical protein